ncbi:MAG: hypothetical protein WC473_02095 [Patescibacteria group bacterium]
MGSKKTKQNHRSGNGSEEAQVAAELAAMQEREQRMQEQAVAVLDETAPEDPAAFKVLEAGNGEEQVGMEMFHSGGIPVVCNTFNEDGTVNSNETTIVQVAVEVSNDLLSKALDGIKAAAGGKGEVVIHTGNYTTMIVAPADMPEMGESILIGVRGIRNMSKAALGKRFKPLTPAIHKKGVDEQRGEFSYTTLLRDGFLPEFVKVTVIHEMKDLRSVAINLERWKHRVGYRREEEVDSDGNPTGRQVFIGPNYLEFPDGEAVIFSGQGIKEQAAVYLLGQNPDKLADGDPKKKELLRRRPGLIGRLGQILSASFEAAKEAGATAPRREQSRNFGTSLGDDSMLEAARAAARLSQRQRS